MSDHNWKKAAPEVPEEFHMKFEETLKQIENKKIIHYKKKSRSLWQIRDISKESVSPRHRME